MKTTFKTWLKQFKKEQNSIGDLSRDVILDNSFPNTRDRDELLRHLRHRNACDGAISAFNKAYKMYLTNI